MRKATLSGAAWGQHPAMNDVDYSADEVEFNMALDRYKRERHRPFPTNREILAVLLSLGYRKDTQPGAKDGLPSERSA